MFASAATAYELAYKFRQGKLPGFDRVFVGYEHHVRRNASNPAMQEFEPLNTVW